MVSTAFMLLTVSTLAPLVHGKYMSKEDRDANGCKGHFCDLKPADYPEEAIDRLVIKDLSALHRQKRESELDTLLVPENGSTAGNCRITTKSRKPYELNDKETAPQIIVQSQFFEQTIPYVECASVNQSCFKDLLRGGSNAEAHCKQKFISIKLNVYDKKNNSINEINGTIPVDCVCEV